MHTAQNAHTHAYAHRGRRAACPTIVFCFGRGHGPTGAGIPGVFPAMTNSPVATGDAGEHVNVVMNGKAGTAMAAYKSQLNDVDLAAVITFERNSFGNSVGDMVQPSAIKNAR